MTRRFVEKRIPHPPTGLTGRVLFADGYWYGVTADWNTVGAPVFALDANGEWFVTTSSIPSGETRLQKTNSALETHLNECGIRANFQKGYASYFIS